MDSPSAPSSEVVWNGTEHLLSLVGKIIREQGAILLHPDEFTDAEARNPAWPALFGLWKTL